MSTPAGEERRLSRATPAIDRPVTSLAVAFLCAVAAVHLFVVPVTLGAAVDGRGLDEGEVGDALGAAGFFYVLVVLTSPLWIARWSWRRVCGVALAVAVLAPLALAATSSYPTYVAPQIALSASLGLLFPPIMAALASASEPDKKFGLALLLQSVLGAAMIYVLKAWVAPAGGYEGVYGVLASYTVLGLLVLPWIPRGVEARSVSDRETPPRPHLVWLGLAALAVYLMTVNGFSSYSERFGEHAGMRGALIAGALAFGVLLSAAGSAVVAVVGDRFGRVRPLIVSLAAALLAYGLLLGPQTEATFLLAICLVNVTFGITTAYAYGTVAAVDTSGRYTGLMAAAAGVGTAIAVTLLGRIIVGHGYGAFIGALAVISVVAAGLMVFVAAQAPARAVEGSERS